MTLTRTLAATAALTALAAPALAQDPAGTVADAMEQAAQTLQLTDPQMSQGRGPDLRGALPGGAMVELDFYRDGTLDEIEADDDNALFPASEVSGILPEALLNAERFPADAMFEKIEITRDGFEAEGEASDGQWFEAEWNPDGSLREWEDD